MGYSPCELLREVVCVRDGLHEAGGWGRGFQAGQGVGVEEERDMRGNALGHGHDIRC